MSLGSNWVDRVRSLQKIPMCLLATNLCINSTISAHFASSLRAVPKQSKMLPNTTKHTKTWAYGPMGWIGCVRYQKFWCDFVARTFALISPVQPVLHQVSCSNETIQNAPKYYKTHQYMSLGFNRVDGVRLLRKILMRLHGTNFCINCTSSTRFCTECRVVTKHCQMHPNTMRRTKTWV